jgi:hypothetical protein
MEEREILRTSEEGEGEGSGELEGLEDDGLAEPVQDRSGIHDEIVWECKDPGASWDPGKIPACILRRRVAIAPSVYR